MKKRKTSKAPFLRFLFVLYCAVMLWLLFGRNYGWVDGLNYEQMLRQNVNLTPLLTIRNYWSTMLHSTDQQKFQHCMINLVGNVVLFIPAGWLLPRLWCRFRNFFLFLITCVLAIFFIEALQLFTLLGSFDVDDIILNLSGMTLGYVIYMIGSAIRKS